MQQEKNVSSNKTGRMSTLWKKMEINLKILGRIMQKV
jgi:hypothetical protein